jgi:glutathione S-transferase
MKSAADDAIKIYSMWACPYAQRTRIMLELKKLPYQLVEIDLTKPRPDWFLALNPTGKVPVVEHEGHVLNESSLINEYLDEAYSQTPVLPASPYQRFAVRTLVEFCNSRFAPNMYRALMEQDDGRRAKAQKQASADWLALEALLERFDAQGDSVFDEFGMAELTYAPFFERYVLNDHYWGFQPLNQPGLARVQRWRDAVLVHPAVKRTSIAPEDYIKLYEDYAYGCSNGAVPEGRTRSSFDLSVPLPDRPLPARRTGSEKLS